MDYEKKYKEALERAKQFANKELYAECNGNLVEYIFPELAESEDEKIREELIAIFKGEIPYTSEEDAKRYIAWLEKQGKQKPFDYENVNIQQKDFAPKVKPKFKVGDWIASNICNSSDLLHIIAVDDNDYEVETTQGNTGVPSIAYIDNNFHLWTIQDAKDGDVLVDEDVDVIGIFEGIEGMCWHSKIYYSNTTKELYGTQCGGSHLKEFAKPATKEQRDLLFQKMKEAGYELDAEKKELKKISQPIRVPC